MKIVGVSIPKNIYNPGDAIFLSVTARWGLADTGGVVQVFRRGEGESLWQLVGTVDIGSPGIGFPNVLKIGKNETVNVSIPAPDSTGFYQIGIKEQGEGIVSAEGTVQLQVVPTTPGAETGTGVVHVMLNRMGPDDLLLYVNGTPMQNLSSSGVYLTLPSGVYMLSANGTGAKTPFDVQVVVVSGQSQVVTLPLSDISKTQTSDLVPIIAVTALFAGIAVIVILKNR